MGCEIEKSDIPASDGTDVKLDLPEGVPPLTALYLYISGSCNLTCRHCWISPTQQTGLNGGKHIRKEYVNKAIHEAKPLGLQMVKLTGGEPMLHPQFRELVDLAGDEGLATQIESNGTLIDEDLAKFMQQREHISFISVSLDGADEKTHDSLRGVRGSFKRAITGIRNLVEQGFQPQLICTLHQGNVSQMGEVIKLAADLGCGSLKFTHVQQVGRGERFADERGLRISEIIALAMSTVNDNKIPVYFDIPIAFCSIRKLLDNQIGGCSVRNILGLLAGGELALCGIGVTVPELIYGHIARDSLRDVWCDSPGLVQLREQVPAQLTGICSHCIHRDLCQGVCVANNFHTSGKINAPYQFCQKADALGIFPESRKREFSISDHQQS
jgi:SynChlorMet cassette radical SAM/SPASM protein ScmF